MEKEKITCLITYIDNPGRPSAFRVSFSEFMEGASKEAQFSNLDQALEYVRNTFPTVLEKELEETE